MIVICGCSWAVGEWSESGAIAGPGLAQYFSFWSAVTNLARPAASNQQQADSLEQFLTQYSPAADDVCYWIVTELCRDVTAIGYSPIETVNTTLSQFLSRANQLARQIPIRLIGGLCDLNDVDITPYPNLSIAVPSWSQLYNPLYPASMYDDIAYELAAQATTTQQKIEIEWLSKQGQQKTQAFKTLPHFRASHPDAAAHLGLRNLLRPDWSTIN